ncbi:MAG: tyrosine-type recombinase/integrase [Pseudomonadota bacterium]|nr:tyrosine-type recombinase/integrase [Pseudomonadota bacterium]
MRERIGGRYKTRILGHADDLTAADGRDVLAFDQALRLVTHPRAAAPVGKLTVNKALDAYLTALAARSKYADDYRGSTEKHVPPALGECRVDRLTKTQIEAWLASMVRNNNDDQDARRRSQDTANRVLTVFRAALNLAFADEANNIGSDAAWRRVKPFRDVARSRDDDLDAKQVRLLIAKAATFDESLAHLIEAGFLTGARFGELAAASVRDLDAARHTLRVDGKTGQRVMSLTDETAEFLRRLAAGRASDAPLLPRSDGERWPRSWHHRAIKKAVALAELPASVSFYTLRHAHISRAIEQAMPLSLVAENVGTSLRMIEANYAHVLAKTRRDTIQKTAPRLRRVK